MDKQSKLLEGVVTQWLAVMTNLYPGRMLNSPAVRDSWLMVLEGYPVADLQVAFRRALTNCKHPPSPADVVGELRQEARRQLPTPEEAWGIVNRIADEVIKKRNGDYILRSRPDIEAMKVQAHPFIHEVAGTLAGVEKHGLDCLVDQVIATTTEKDKSIFRAHFVKAYSELRDRLLYDTFTKGLERPTSYFQLEGDSGTAVRLLPGQGYSPEED